MRIDETAAEFETHEFQATRESVCEAHGDTRVQFADCEETVTTVLERAGDEEYQSYEELRTALFCGLPASAVGRRFYSDRNSPAVGEEGRTPVSF